MKRIADPVHGTIALSDLEVELLQTLTFQRLRGIKQLGLANLVFPGADYSRLSHCIGVCHITGRLIEGINDKAHRIPDEDTAMYRAAALLHDVGHYPFSHSMERALRAHHQEGLTETRERFPVEDSLATSAPLDHEQLGAAIISLGQGEVPEVLHRHGVDPDKLVAIIGHHVDAPPFANLVSSDLDADRIDYLLRTAHHTRLPYGHIDLDYLLAMVDVDNERRICLDQRALRTAEHLLLARYFDYQQVSFHKTVAAYEQLLEDVLGALVHEAKLDCSPPQLLEVASSPPDWVQFDDGYVTSLIRQRSQDRESIAGRKAHALTSRAGAKLVWTSETFSDREQSVTAHGLLTKVLRSAKNEIADAAGVPPEFVWIWEKRTPLTAIASHIPASRMVDLDADEERAFGQSVRIADGKGGSVPLSELPNSIVSVLADQALSTVRVYVLPPDKPIDIDHVHGIIVAKVGL